MKISERTIKRLQEVINGDCQSSPYRTGPKLVDFFNDIGCNDVHMEGFQSRKDYTRKSIRKFNNTDNLRKIIESALVPRDYIVQENNIKTDTLSLEKSVEYLNQFLFHDGYIIKKDNACNLYKVYCQDGGVIANETLATLSHEFIQEQIEKANSKLAREDYDGAITNARSLVEAIQEEIIRKSGASIPKHDGDLLKLYKEVKKVLNLDPFNKDLSDTLKQILTGLNSLVAGLSGLSNKMADRHSRTYKPARRHAKLAVNVALTFSEFLLESFEYQDKAQKQLVN